MNRKQLIVLLVLVAALGGAAFLYHRKQAASWTGGNLAIGQKLLGNFQVNDVAAIRIQQGADKLDLIKTNDLWRVRERGDYPADFSKISQLLLKLGDLKIVQTIPVGPSQRGRLDLLAPDSKTNAATALEFFNAGGQPLHTLWLGKNHEHESGSPSPESEESGWPDGRYVLAATNSPTVAVISDALSEAAPQADQWLDKAFFKVEKPQSISVSYPNTTNSWKLVRAGETNGWKLANAKPHEKLDESQVSETANALSSPGFSDVAENLTHQQTGLDKPTRVNVKTFDGFDYSMNVGSRTNNDYYFTVDVSANLPKAPPVEKNASPTNNVAAQKSFEATLKHLKSKLTQESALDNHVYLVPTWTLETLLKRRSQLLLPPVAQTNAPSVKVKH
jgi:Domain of unknown function (DUF4340)